MLKRVIAVVALLILPPSRVFAQVADSTAGAPASSYPDAVPPTAAPTASPSITNPAISVIGWFQAVAGNDSTAQENPFELREAELGFQAAVDPFARADFFLSAGPEGLEVEEGTITWLSLPGGGQAKFGKFRADLGKFNRTHPPETPFADRPLATVAFLGEEGLVTTGVAASALIPNPFNLYWDIVANVGTAPDPEEQPLFEAHSRSQVLALGRSSVFVPVSESTDLNLGLSYANGPALESLVPEGSRAQLGAADVTLRWKNPRRSIYRSLVVQAEFLQEKGSGSGSERRGGTFAYLVYQFSRRWKLGARYDWTERLNAPDHASGGLAFLQYQPSEFSVMSLQTRHVRDAAEDTKHDTVFLKWTFNIGPHGAHPY